MTSAPLSPTAMFDAVDISPNTITLGITIGLLASFIQSLGLTIQRKSHVLNQRLPEHEQRVEHRRPLWLLGFGIFITSNVLGSLVQIASLPVVILAPLGAVSLLWNAFFARFLLGDVFSLWMVLGTLFIIGGAFLIAWFGIVPEPTRSLEDLLELFRRPTFVAYFSLLGIVVVIALLITHVTEYSLRRRLAAQPNLPISLPQTSPVLVASPMEGPEEIVTERTPLLDRKSPSPSPSPSLLFSSASDSPAVQRTRVLLALSYSSFSGIISGMCLLFAKSGVELLLHTLKGNNQFWRWQSWVLLLNLGLFALLQLWYLHKALTLADPTLVCPSAFCFYNLSAIVNGLVYFDEFGLIPPMHLILVITGFFTLLAGVWIVSIQPGVDGVDVGSWAEGNAAAALDEERETSEVEVPDEEAIPVDVRERRRQDVEEDPRWRERLKRRETRSESNIVKTTYTSPDRFGSMVGLGLPSARRLSTHPVGAPSTISLPRSERSRSASPSRSPHQRLSMWRRRRPTLEGHPYFTQAQTLAESLAGPLIRQSPSRPHSQVSTTAIGPGFHIGLSPLSPGFAILPRRRRVSGVGSRMAAAGGHDEEEDSRRSSSEGRNFSEGDLSRHVSRMGGEAIPEEVGEVRGGNKGKGKGKSGKGKSRLDWLKRLTRR